MTDRSSNDSGIDAEVATSAIHAATTADLQVWAQPAAARTLTAP